MIKRVLTLGLKTTTNYIVSNDDCYDNDYDKMAIVINGGLMIPVSYS